MSYHIDFVSQLESYYRVTALSANILYLDSLGTEGVNLGGCVFYMKMLCFFALSEYVNKVSLS